MNADGTRKIEVTPVNNYLVWIANFSSDSWSLSWTPDDNRIDIPNSIISTENAGGTNRQLFQSGSGSRMLPYRYPLSCHDT